MSITPEQIKKRSFAKRWRGYDVDEVETFVAEVARELQDQIDAAELAAKPPESTEIIDSARAEAANLVETAERNARDRSTEVIADTQARLDKLLAEESEARKRVEELAQHDFRPDPEDEAHERAVEQPVPDLNAVDDSLADYMKEAVRNEVRPQ